MKRGGNSDSENSLPKTATDHTMSIRHVRDSIKYNEKHAKDHLRAAKGAKARLRKLVTRRVRSS